MKYKRPLVNPTVRDFEIETEVQQQPVLGSRDQLSFKVDSPKTRLAQRINSLVHNFKRRKDLLEINVIWRNPAIPFSLVSVVLVTLVPIIVGIFRFGSLPPRVPFFYNNVDNHWEQFDKSILFIFPAFLGLIEVVVINFLVVIYKSDKRLSKALAWTMLFLNIMFFIAFVQIYLLIT